MPGGVKRGMGKSQSGMGAGIDSPGREFLVGVKKSCSFTPMIRNWSIFSGEREVVAR